MNPPPLSFDYEARLVGVCGREYNETGIGVNRGCGAKRDDHVTALSMYFLITSIIEGEVGRLFQCRRESLKE